MKKLVNQLLFLTLAASFVLTGCKYDDGPNFSLRTKKARLVGEWQLDEVEIDGTDYTSEFNRWEIEFKKDNKYNLSAEIINAYYGNITINDDGEWDFSNDKLELEVKSDDGEQTDYEIKRLTNKELWFEYTETYDDGTSERWDCKFEKK